MAAINLSHPSIVALLFSAIIFTYHQRLLAMPFVQATSYALPTLGDDGVVN
jgi:hypothetical protein